MSILTNSEAMAMLRLDGSVTDHPQLTTLLPAIDDFIKNGTGRDWAADSMVSPLAKMAAQMLLTQWYDNPAAVGKADELRFGLSSLLGQLEAKALQLAAEVVT